MPQCHAHNILACGKAADRISALSSAAPALPPPPVVLTANTLVPYLEAGRKSDATAYRCIVHRFKIGVETAMGEYLDLVVSVTSMFRAIQLRSQTG